MPLLHRTGRGVQSGDQPAHARRLGERLHMGGQLRGGVSLRRDRISRTVDPIMIGLSRSSVAMRTFKLFAIGTGLVIEHNTVPTLVAHHHSPGKRSLPDRR